MALTVLGIETSCDETVAAVYQEGRGIVSNELFSQIDLHKLYGGVMPEIASRAHLEKINEIVAHALKKANVTLDDVDVVADLFLSCVSTGERGLFELGGEVEGLVGLLEIGFEEFEFVRVGF